ncbi:hypothetical protein Slin15195_G106600 [Septoria linicola]|uniref:Uncharacterized protein n=1 Tax=Septoria linicola TaxID=215465 RepID=A0A9Q9B6Q6_9PEZI|nr:hypothetical protein Slin14017_G069570 [Septoria linicola]USW57341.1 hypothetical protein Slin15195_G106600 [Septoria linicola]
MASSDTSDEVPDSISDPTDLADLEKAIEDYEDWELSSSSSLNSDDASWGPDCSAFYYQGSDDGSEDQDAGVFEAECEDSAYTFDWASVSKSRFSSVSLLPSPLNINAQPEESSNPPPIPAKSPKRIDRLIELIFEYEDAETILDCYHNRLIPWSAMRVSSICTRKLWFGAAQQPIPAQQSLSTVALGPDKTSYFYLNSLVHSLRAYGEAKNLPFGSTNCRYQESTGKWLLTVRCSEASLSLQNEKTWGGLRLAFASEGVYDVRVSVYARRPSQVGVMLDCKIECTNDLRIRELMICTIFDLLERKVERTIRLPSALSSLDALWYEKQLGSCAAYRRYLCSECVPAQTPAEEILYLTDDAGVTSRNFRSRLPMSVGSNLRSWLKSGRLRGGEDAASSDRGNYADVATRTLSVRKSAKHPGPGSASMLPRRSDRIVRSVNGSIRFMHRGESARAEQHGTHEVLKWMCREDER